MEIDWRLGSREYLLFVLGAFSARIEDKEGGFSWLQLQSGGQVDEETTECRLRGMRSLYEAEEAAVTVVVVVLADSGICTAEVFAVEGWRTLAELEVPVCGGVRVPVDSKKSENDRS